MTAIEEEVEYLWQKIPFNVKKYLFTFIFLALIKDGCQKKDDSKTLCLAAFKQFTCKKINTSTQNVVKEELRVYCQYSNCNANYK